MCTWHFERLEVVTQSGLASTKGGQSTGKTVLYTSRKSSPPPQPPSHVSSFRSLSRVTQHSGKHGFLFLVNITIIFTFDPVNLTPYNCKESWSGSQLPWQRVLAMDFTGNFSWLDWSFAFTRWEAGEEIKRFLSESVCKSQEHVDSRSLSYYLPVV